MIDLAIRGIKIEEIPGVLNKAAILVSNYPGVSETLRAVMKVGCRLPGENLRLKAIAREGILTESHPIWGGFLKAGVLPAQKEDGIYRLKPFYAAKALKHLESGGVLWLSPTGETKGNGMLEEYLKPGAVNFALKCQIPIVPMGLETNNEGKVIKVIFGEEIKLPPEEKINVFDRDKHVHLLSVLVLARIAQMLPVEQRGDFKNMDLMLPQILSKLLIYQDVKDLC